MPHLRLRGVSDKDAAMLSQKLLPELAVLTNTPVEHFSLELVSTQFFSQGAPFESEPFCEVLWFDRGQSVQDQTAALMNRHLREVYPSRDAVVVFHILDRKNYYENGIHFGRASHRD